jgi:NADH-quinone oxidoreductase subunit M
MLAWTIYLSFAGALAEALLPKGRNALARWLALAVAVAGLALAVAGFAAGMGQGRQVIVDAPWVPSMGIRFLLAADGISRVLVLLTGLAAVAGVLFSWNIELRTNEFFAFFLALIGGVYGVFLSFDLFLLFVFYEVAIVPKYFLIAIWGSTRREYAAMKLALYSFAGSAMVLIGLLAAYATAGSHSTGLIELAHAGLPASFQMWCFPLVFTGFAILAGMWPFHTWAPTGHVAAPTAASMLLAGVVMKLGAYGCLRVAIALFPRGLDPWGFSFAGIGSWRDVFAVLAVVGIVYGALVALVQTDFKFVIGYSSVSHMGFVLLGLVTLNQIGVTGAVLQMFSHGIIAGSALRHCGAHRLRAHAHAPVCGAGDDALIQAPALCRLGLCDRRNGLDGAAGLLRLRGRVAGAGGRLDGQAVVDGCRGRGHRGGRGLYLESHAEGILQRCAARRARA